MVKYIIKRDGEIQEFNPQNIINAINKAISANPQIDVPGNISECIADIISNNIFDEKVYIEDIQDMVESELMQRCPELAKKYILYREARNAARKRKEYETTMSVVNTEANEITKENANMNTDTPAGMMMKFASESSKQFTYDMLLSDKTKDFMSRNLIYPHDLDYYPTKSLTCLQHPMDKILTEGFRAGHGASRPAKRIETAAIISCISMETIQNEMHGGQAIPAFDFYLAPYVKYTFVEELKKAHWIDKNIPFEELKRFAENYIEMIGDYIEVDMDEWDANKEGIISTIIQISINNTINRVHQAMESFIHNMNTIHSRGGNQVVFSSINYGTDTSPEGRCIIRELLISTYEGVGNGETPIFPIQVWKKKKGVNYLPEDPNYDLYKYACKVTAKRFFPNFLNLDASFNIDPTWKADDPKRYMHEVATMGCRTRVYENRNGEKTSVGRGNLSFTTINFPKIAMLANENATGGDMIIYFFNLLDECIDAAADQLYDRFVWQSSALKKQFPLLMSGMWENSDTLNSNDSIKDVIKTGTLGIGFIGLAEALIVLTGHHHGENEESQKLGLEIIEHMYERIQDIAEERGLNYSLLATPAEGLSGKFIKKDRKEFGDIHNVTDKEYYTNSSHVPVWYKCSVEYKAKIEGPYHKYEGGGHIFYVEFDGDATHNIEAIMQTVDLMDKYDIGYSSINHLRNRCLDCGHEDADADVKICPICGSENIDTLQRITGYLVGSVSRWNSAKKAELRDRVTHTN